MKLQSVISKGSKLLSNFGRIQPHILSMVFLLCTFASSISIAQTAEVVVQPKEIEPATIMVYNREITTLRSPLLGGSPRARAQVAEQRINAQLEKSGTPKITALSNPLGNIIQMDGSLSFVITANDVDKLNGETLESATSKAKYNLQQVIAVSKESRDTDRILKGLGTVGAATAIMLALFWLLNRVKGLIDKKLLLLTHKKKIIIFGADVFSQGRLIQLFSAITRSAYWIIASLVSYLWLSLCLEQFPYTRPWGEELHQFLIDLFFKYSKGNCKVHAQLCNGHCYISGCSFYYQSVQEFF